MLAIESKEDQEVGSLIGFVGLYISGFKVHDSKPALAGDWAKVIAVNNIAKRQVISRFIFYFLF
jgi:hypothetical protein